MKISELLRGVDAVPVNLSGEEISPGAVSEYMEREITDITNDSRKVRPGSLFFCIPGANYDGHDYAGAAAAQGAAALVVSHEVTVPDDIRLPVILKVADPRYSMAVISANFYGNPAKELKVIGITGTKGKTTTTYMIRQMLENAGIPTGLVGTIEVAYGSVHIHAENTTPESIDLQRTFRDMVNAGMKAVVMEVSSQALMLHRTAGFIFDIGMFTNIEPDHIGPNEHASFEEYLNCKAKLFSQCRIAIANGDDPHTDDVLAHCGCPVEKYGFEEGNDLRASDFTLIRTKGELGVCFTVSGLMNMTVTAPVPGRFSVYNAMAAMMVARHFGITGDAVNDALRGIRVRGRIELIPVSDSFTLLIDYAHNAMALENLLSTLKEYRPERLVCLFGCGGNRSKLRRFEMGEVSGNYANLTIITSDNPRFEDPMDIIADIRTGISRTKGEYIEIPDRKEAIRYAIKNGQSGDIIVLAGKGHEDYQEIKGVKYPMDERDLIRDILAEEAQNTEGGTEGE